jgi:hypothetical protein
LLPASVAAPAFQSVADFLSAYDAKKKTIDDLTNKFVDKAGEAKKAQDDILPHLADMQSLLSKKGTNHPLVIAARKQGHKIPWWTEYYESYKDKLWESLRTMERRIAAYRKDPTAPAPTPNLDPVPHLNRAERKALVEGNHRAVEIVVALEAGRDAKREIAEFKAVMNATRLDDIMQAHEQEPDYKGILSKVLQTVADMKGSLPDKFVKAVRELTKPCKLTATLVPTVQTTSTKSRPGKKALTPSPVPETSEPEEEVNEEHADQTDSDQNSLSNEEGQPQEFEPELLTSDAKPETGVMSTTKVGDKSEPTSHGFYYEFVRDEKPYAVRDMNNPHVGVMFKCKSKTEADKYINDREREAAEATKVEMDAVVA